jgi:predicted  nucleic acid-binding Zn-ribbon protein
MTTSEHTHDQIVALIRLQHIDSRIHRIQKLRGDLPIDIADLEDELAGLETRIERLQQEAKDLADSRGEAERMISEAEGAIERYEKQQLQVRNNREYDALTKEIEANKQRIADAKEHYESFDVIEAENANNTEESQQRLDELSALIEEKGKDLKVVIGDTENEMKDLETMRDETIASIDTRYLGAYQRLVMRLRDGRAVVPLVRGAAAGFAVPPQRQVEIRQGNRIVVCEHTGRIIVDEKLFGQSRPESFPALEDLVEQT